MPAAVAVVGLAATAYQANKQSKAAKSAANTQAQSAQDANKVQLQMFNQARADNEPFRQNALTAQNEYMQLMGLGAPQQAPQVSGAQVGSQGMNSQGAYTQGVYANNPFEQFSGGASQPGSMFDGSTMGPLMARNARIFPMDRGMAEAGGGLIRQQQPQQQAAAPAMTSQQMQQSAFDRFRNTPGYQFGLDTGRKQLESSAAARSGLYSGATFKALQKFGNDYADQQGYTPYMSRLASLAGMGQTVNAQNQQVGMNYANQAGANLINAGNARASGIQGSANAWGQAAGNVAGIAGWLGGQYQKPASGGGYFGWGGV